MFGKEGRKKNVLHYYWQGHYEVGRGVGGWVKAMAAKEKELFIKLFMQKKTRSDGH